MIDTQTGRAAARAGDADPAARPRRWSTAPSLGHIGGEFSAIDILATLYFGVLRIDPTRPDDPERDRFILSKGHCAGALYTTLAHARLLSDSTSSRPSRSRSRASTATPTATRCRASRPTPARWATACRSPSAAPWRPRWTVRPGARSSLTGDGELQEGSNWEAAMSAAHYKLDNLTVIVDRNGLQQGDCTERTMHLEPLADKWRAFGWSVREVDGHDHRRVAGDLRAAALRVRASRTASSPIPTKARASPSCATGRPGTTSVPSAEEYAHGAGQELDERGGGA